MSGRARDIARNVPLPEANLLALALGASLSRLAPWRVPGTPAVHRIAGAALICLGAGLIAGAVASSRDVHLAHADRLVTTGTFARSRNPMYLGWALLHAGVGVAASSGWVLAALPAACWRVHREVLAEEDRLNRRFPEEFQRYTARVPRYVPRLGRSG